MTARANPERPYPPPSLPTGLWHQKAIRPSRRGLGLLGALFVLSALAGCGSSHPLSLDNDGDGYCEQVPCSDGSQYGDCDDFDAKIYPGAEELCNGIDDDCSKKPGDDEVDLDFDGFMVCENDCDDEDASRHPGALEICNGIDDDCDGIPSEAGDVEDSAGEGGLSAPGDPARLHQLFGPLFGQPLKANGDGDEGLEADGALGCANFYRDEDGDGYGSDGDWRCLCAATGAYTATRGADCDDQNPNVSPAMVEHCNAIDDDCDGLIDENFDADQDGATTCAVGTNPGDCDDNDASLNTKDLDGDGYSTCDGDCDDDDVTLTLADLDGDGASTCPQGEKPGDCDDSDPALNPNDADGDGFSSCEGDCDDNASSVNPGAPELCNGGRDDDCNPGTLEDADADGDGFTGVCGGDCDDTRPDVHPGAAEIDCDGLDGDCDGRIERLVGADASVSGKVQSDRPDEIQKDGPNDVQNDSPDEVQTDDPGAIQAYATIQAAIETSKDGDMVCVQPGIYFETIDFGGRDITVRGIEGSSATVIDADGMGPAVSMIGDEGPETVLQGFTLLHGRAYEGGGLLLRGSSPTLEDLVITDNYAEHQGGGVFMDEGAAPVISNLEVSYNISGGKGGGLFLDGVSPSIEGLEVLGNEAGSDGGGAYLAHVGSSAHFSDVTVHYNQAPGAYGGGFFLSASSPRFEHLEIAYNTADYVSGLELVSSDATLLDVNIHDNLADQNYGGLYIYSSAPSLTDVLVTDNEAISSHAGISLLGATPSMTRVFVARNVAVNYAGISFFSGSDATLDDVQVLDNVAEVNYSGLTMTDSDPLLSFVTVAGNSSSGTYGGGMFLMGSSPVLYNVIVAENISPRGAGGLWVASTSAPQFFSVSIAGNLASTYGGGLVVKDQASLTATNVAVVGNSAGTYGGGIYLASSGRSLLSNVVIAYNTSELCGGGLYLTSGATTPVLRYSDFYGNGPDQFCGMASAAGSEGNIAVTPEFVGYDSGQEALTWDLTLEPGSALIDAGDAEISDPDGSRSDIGAYGGPYGGW